MGHIEVTASNQRLLNQRRYDMFYHVALGLRTFSDVLEVEELKNSEQARVLRALDCAILTDAKSKKKPPKKQT